MQQQRRRKLFMQKTEVEAQCVQLLLVSVHSMCLQVVRGKKSDGWSSFNETVVVVWRSGNALVSINEVNLR